MMLGARGLGELSARQRLFSVVQTLGGCNFIQNRGAARRGKRIERARLARINAAKRRLLEAKTPKKKHQINSLKIDKDQLRFQTERQLDTTLPNPPEDDVYFFNKFRKKKYSLDEIIEFHRQTAHPDVYNQPDALISATIELNLKMKIKRKRYIERIESTLRYPHIYEYQVRSRKIIALCKQESDQDAARAAGAVIVGSADVAALLKTNQLTQRDFDHIVCHNDYLDDFSAVKGMKAQSYFPSKQRGNHGDDIVELVKYFKEGVDYRLKRTTEEPEIGYIDCHFGRLNMTNEQLQENLIALFNSINRFKPLNLMPGKQFFERVLITSAASQEVFLLRFWDLIDDYVDPGELVIDEDEDEKKKAQA